MAGPWERYSAAESLPAAAPAEGPWAKFAVQPEPQRGVMDKLLGTTGERYQTWPEKAVRGLFALPEKTITAAASQPAGSREATEAMFGPAWETTLATAGGLGTLRTGVPKPVTPTTEALNAAGSAGYNQAREMGLQLAPESIVRLADTTAAQLERIGLNADLAPDTFRTLARMREAPPGSHVDVSNLETIRATLREAARNFNNPREQKAASQAIAALDDHLANVGARDVVAGDPAAASRVLSDARGNYAAAKRAETLDDAAWQAELNAGSANSGQNVNNATRQQLKGILKNDKKSSGFSDDELAQMERVVTGTGAGNTARYIGNLLGGGGGLGQITGSGIGAGVGAALAGPVGAGVGAAVPPVTGAIAKALGNASTRRQSDILSEMVRQRSPLYQGQPLPSGVPDSLPYGALISALLQQQGAHR